MADLKSLAQSQPLLLESVEINFIPGYVAQQRFVKRWQPRIITVSVGGDDIGFGDLLRNCVEPHISRHQSDGTCYNTYEDRLELAHLIDRTVPRWTALYEQLRREAPDMRLYAVGYPQVAVDTGSCALNVQLNKSELEFAESTIDYLNGAVRKAAVAAGVTYVDISQALKGHRLCETASYNVAMNGLTAGKDAGFLGAKLFGKESYHPNALGQELIEQAILRQTRNLAGPAGAGDTLGEDGAGANFDKALALLDAPKTGRSIYTIVPGHGLVPEVVKRGLNIPVQGAGVGNGLRPGASYMIHLDKAGEKPLATITADVLGNVAGTINIASDTVPGGHTMHVTGENQLGEPVDITQSFYILSSDADSDGDGIEDITDSCPGAINSSQDMDRDGVDDICDPLIGVTNSQSDSGDNNPSVPGASRSSAWATGSGNSVFPKAPGNGPRRLASHHSKAAVKGVRVDFSALSPSLRTLPRVLGLLGITTLFLLLILLVAGRYTQKVRFRLQ